jgi:chitin disaccharide deacetylase
MRTIYASSLANFSELSRRPSNDRTADRDKVLAQINALVAGLLILGVATNPGFAGAYNFVRATAYDTVFASFLDGLPDGGVVMCHPGFVDAELQRLDHLTSMREQEYAFFAGERFPQLLAGHGFALA